MRSIAMSPIRGSSTWGLPVYILCATTCFGRTLYLQLMGCVIAMVNNLLGFELVAHAAGNKFYTTKNSRLTEAIDELYPLSTPLIIRTAWLNKENLLIRTWGEVR